MEKIRQRVILVYANQTIIEEEIEETLQLIDACEMQLTNIIKQKFKSVSFSTYIGKGKVQEIFKVIERDNIERVIFQQELTPLQFSNLESIWGIPVIDRSELIINIFAQRAKSKEAKLQVESCRLKKLLPRLIGMNVSLGRQGGGKNKGSGETQLEMDKRRIKAKIHELDRELKEVKTVREVQRRQRKKNELPLVALVGYSNAGKSTLMNALLTKSKTSGESVLAQDMLFATLDTSVRNITMANQMSFLLFDTVGFVSHLPHELIKAFHSTLEEVTYADLLLQVIDISSPFAQMQMEVTTQTLKQIGASHIPMIHVYNKCDESAFAYPKVIKDDVYMSAEKQIGIDNLLECIKTRLNSDYVTLNLVIPYTDLHIIKALHRDAIIIKQENYDYEMAYIVKLKQKTAEKYVNYVKL